MDMTYGDGAAIEAVRVLLAHIGEDCERDGLLETPSRVVKALKEMTSGYSQDVASILAKQFDVEYRSPVIVKNIAFASLCEHHMLPFIGTANVAYIPSHKVVGLSKIPRTVAAFANRLQVQERLTTQIAEALQNNLNPLGVGVCIKAHHQCMSCRGIKMQGAVMKTQVFLGEVLDDFILQSDLLIFD